MVTDAFDLNFAKRLQDIEPSPVDVRNFNRSVFNKLGLYAEADAEKRAEIGRVLYVVENVLAKLARAYARVESCHLEAELCLDDYNNLEISLSAKDYAIPGETTIRFHRSFYLDFEKENLFLKGNDRYFNPSLVSVANDLDLEALSAQALYRYVLHQVSEPERFAAEFRSAKAFNDYAQHGSRMYADENDLALLFTREPHLDISSVVPKGQISSDGRAQLARQKIRAVTPE